MTDSKKTDITLQVLVSIRDEIKGFREDTNRRFAGIEADISQIRQDIGRIVARFDRDFLLMATDVDSLKQRLKVCEEHLGIRN
jgi:hypothetical protein